MNDVRANEAIFMMQVDHKKVKKQLKELLARPESKTVREAGILFYHSLLCCEIVYVPESQLTRFVDLCKRVK